MAYRVEFRPRAEYDLETLYRELVQAAPLRGPEWVDGLQDSIESLSERPLRCPVIGRLSKGVVQVRRLLYGTYPHIYKVYFALDGETVSILHIRHGARREPSPRELLR